MHCHQDHCPVGTREGEGKEGAGGGWMLKGGVWNQEYRLVTDN